MHYSCQGKYIMQDDKKNYKKSKKKIRYLGILISKSMMSMEKE